MKLFLDNVYRHLATFYWSHWHKSEVGMMLSVRERKRERETAPQCECESVYKQNREYIIEKERVPVYILRQI